MTLQKSGDPGPISLQTGKRNQHTEEKAQHFPQCSVRVYQRHGYKYLKTDADATSRNNLDNLPECESAAGGRGRAFEQVLAAIGLRYLRTKRRSKGLLRMAYRRSAAWHGRARK
jgi:hypothetical protein